MRGHRNLADWIIFCIPNLCGRPMYLQTWIWIWARIIASFKVLFHISDLYKLGKLRSPHSTDGSLFLIDLEQLQHIILIYGN